MKRLNGCIIYHERMTELQKNIPKIKIKEERKGRDKCNIQIINNISLTYTNS